MIPSGYKEDKLYSVKPRNGDGDFTFTRASTGTRVNADGYIEEVPWNKAQYSQDFANAYWSKQCDINSDTQTSPIGSNDADEIVETTTQTYQYWYKLISLNVGVEQTFSVYVKYIDCQYFQLTAYNGAVYGSANFDLINKTYNTAASSGSYEVVSANIEELDNDWMRVSMTFKSLSSTSPYIALCMDNNSSAGYVPYYTGTGLKTAIWGFQWNAGTIKPYIKTTDRLDIPRLDYSGGSTNPTLLLEGQSTNLVTYSEQLDNAWWTKVNATINSNDIVSPDGTQNADALVDDTTYGVHRVNTSNINIVSGNSYSFSGFVKSGSVDFLHISPSGGQFSSDNTTVINMSNGTLVSKEHTGPVSIINYNNGWYRFEVTLTAISSSLYSKQYFNPSLSSTSPIYTGTNEISCYMWGLQVEQGNLTSYIPTSGTSVTRVADVCEDAGDATIFNDAEGVLFAEIAALADDQTSRTITIDGDGTNENRVIIQYQPSVSNQIRALLKNNDNSSVELTYVLSDITDYAKIAFKYKSGDLALWINGVEIDTSTDAIFLSNLKELSFDNGRGSSNFYGKVKQLIYFDQALTDDELEELTTI